MTDNKKIKESTKWLKSYRPMKKHIEVLNKKIEIAERTLNCDDGIGAMKLGNISSKHSFSSVVEDTVLREVSKIDELKASRDTYKDIIEIIEIAIESLKFDEKQVIYLYYIADVQISWYQVASIMKRSEDNVKGYLKRKALINLYKSLYGEETEDLQSFKKRISK